MIEYTVKVYENGTKEWYLNGRFHREDGPAVEESNGYKEWFLNGDRHRVDGPAVEYPDGHKAWYLNGFGLSEEEFNARQSKSCNGKIITIDGKQYKLSEL